MPYTPMLYTRMGVLGAGILLLAGCSIFEAKNESGSSTEKKVRLSLYSAVNDGGTQDVIRRITHTYENEHPGVAVEVQFPGNDYENIMRMKMSGNDMPDLFDTHGWSQNRYGKFLADLSGEPWTGSITAPLRPLITDAAGKVYVLPLNAAKDGITYNKEVLQKYGVAVPKTLDELIAAGEKIKRESQGTISPFFFSVPDAVTLAQFFDYFATSLLIAPKENEADALLKGSFDWSKWTPLPEKFKEIYDKGLMNEDVFTAPDSEKAERLAQGKAVFFLGNPGFVADAAKINPEVNAGIMPVPAMVEGDEPSFAGGERFTLGVWKDSSSQAAARELLREFAKRENLKSISEASGTPAGMKGIDPDLGRFTADYNLYKEARIFPYFDRVYLPGGMWEIMKGASEQLLSGKLSPEQFSELMRKEDARLKAKHSKASEG